MDLGSNISKGTYIVLLKDSLNKKMRLLNQLIILTELQEKVILKEPFDDEEFDKIISQKEEQLEILSKLDLGFEQLFQNVKEDINLYKEQYRDEIKELQQQIMVITDNSVRLQTMEKRNKSRIESLFAMKRKEIKSSRVSNQNAANYYKTMAKQHETPSYFYDKKN